MRRQADCLVGFVHGAAEGETVRIHPVCKPDEEIVTRTDQLGWFAFTGIAPGVYEVSGSNGEAIFHSQRGPAIEVWSLV